MKIFSTVSHLFVHIKQIIINFEYIESDEKDSVLQLFYLKSLTFIGGMIIDILVTI
jgi:hypothetical protein